MQLKAAGQWLLLYWRLVADCRLQSESRLVDLKMVYIPGEVPPEWAQMTAASERDCAYRALAKCSTSQQLIALRHKHEPFLLDLWQCSHPVLAKVAARAT